MKKKIDGIFDEAKEEVFKHLESIDTFEHFKLSLFFDGLSHRLAQLPNEFNIPKKRNSISVVVQCEIDTYVTVAKLLISYNLVEYTDLFVQNGYTALPIIAKLTEKEIEKIATNENDKKRLTELCKAAKDNTAQPSKILTGEAIHKVKKIQQNFLEFLS